jgi:hypothetical protein
MVPILRRFDQVSSRPFHLQDTSSVTRAPVEYQHFEPFRWLSDYIVSQIEWLSSSLPLLRRWRARGALPCRENGLRRWLTVRRTVVAFCNVFVGRWHGAFGRHDQRSFLRGGGGLVGRCAADGEGGGLPLAPLFTGGLWPREAAGIWGDEGDC